MNATTTNRFELRFRSLFAAGRTLAFPCDATGRVDLDALSEHARCSYFFARGVVGRDFAAPAVEAAPPAAEWHRPLGEATARCPAMAC